MGTPAALFDFDGTITRSDSLLPFLASLVRWYPNTLAGLPDLLAQVSAYFLGRATGVDVKTAALRLVCRVARTEREALLERFAEERLPGMLKPGGPARIAWHRAQGHRLILASASLELYLKPIAARLGFEHVIGTPGTLEPVPRVSGPNCLGREKVERLFEEPWFEEVDWARSWAYSDDLVDLPMLLLCGHPVAVDPSRALRRFALAQGWPITCWA